MFRVIGQLSYVPFLNGPGRTNDVVRINNKNFTVIHADDFLSPRIGWNAANNSWQNTVFNLLVAHGDTGFTDLTFSNLAELRLLQLTGIEINSPYLFVSLKQPSKITRLGVSSLPEGQIDGLMSPWGSPVRLRHLFTVQNKPAQMRAQNYAIAHNTRPVIRFRGFLYELKEGPAAAGVFFEPYLGGIE